MTIRERLKATVSSWARGGVYEEDLDALVDDILEEFSDCAPVRDELARETPCT
jgi:hypothetical protein